LIANLFFPSLYWRWNVISPANDAGISAGREYTPQNFVLEAVRDSLQNKGLLTRE
jgi:hypothetical protein